MPSMRGQGLSKTYLTLNSIVPFAHIIRAATTPQCYWVNGFLANNDFQPCNTNLHTGSQSACCNLGKNPPDICLGNGLCQRQDATSSDFLIYAVGCTDQSGRDASCSQYCHGLSSEMYSLQLCGDSRWCCNNQSVSTCCNNDRGDFAFDLLSLALTTESNSPTIVTTAVVTVTGQVQETSNGGFVSTGNQRDRSVVVVGTSLGAVLGLTLLGCFVAFLLVSKRLKKANTGSTIWSEKVEQTHNRRTEMEVPELVGTGLGRHELQGRQITAF